MHYTPFAYAADIMDRVSPKFHELGLEYECVGGGRIRHDSKEKKIHIYGYSVVSFCMSVGIHCTLYIQQCKSGFLLFDTCTIRVTVATYIVVYIVHHMIFDVLIGITCGCIAWGRDSVMRTLELLPCR